MHASLFTLRATFSTLFFPRLESLYELVLLTQEVL